jgi:hypothetical protein
MPRRDKSLPAGGLHFKLRNAMFSQHKEKANPKGAFRSLQESEDAEFL